MNLLKKFKKLDADKATTWLGMVGAGVLVLQSYGVQKEWIGFIEAGLVLGFSYLTNKPTDETTNR